MNRDVGQALHPLDQHRISAQLRREFDQRHMAHDAGEVDRGFHTGVTAAHNRYALALEQRPVAVRAVSHALVAVFLLARDTQLAPACAGGEDDAARGKLSTAFELHAHRRAGPGGRHQLGAALHAHDVHAVLHRMRFQRSGELWPLCFKHADVILDAERVQSLATKAFRHDTSADALACGIHRCSCTSRPTADDQNIVRRLG